MDMDYSFKSGNPDRDFWVWGDRESGSSHYSEIPAFFLAREKRFFFRRWRAARKVIGVMPHSLIVTTLSALTTEVVKGNGNISRIAIRGTTERPRRKI